MRSQVAAERVRGVFKLFPLLPLLLLPLLLLLLGPAAARAALTPVGAPGEFTAPLILNTFDLGSTNGISWTSPAISTNSTSHYNGPLPSPSRFLRCSGPLTLTFSQPTTQVGMWFGRDDSGLYPQFDVTLEAFAAGSSLGSVTTAANMNYDVDQFIGFISTDELDSVVVTYSVPSYMVIVDDVYFAEPIRPPPPPDPDPNDAFAVNFISDARSVTGYDSLCEFDGGCTTQNDLEVPASPYAAFNVSTVGGGYQNSGFDATGFWGTGQTDAGSWVGAGFSQVWDSTSELTVEFEVTTPATLTLIVGPNIYNANIELVEETFPLFSAVGSNTDITHEDVLYPGRTYTLTANTLLGRWNFDLDIEEQVTALPALDDAGKSALFLALIAAASLALARRPTALARARARGARSSRR